MNSVSRLWPYSLPIFRRTNRAVSPDGKVVAAIDSAHEVSMGNPTRGTLVLSTGLRLDGCNPSFVWSDDSRYLAVPRYVAYLGLFRRQRMAIVDVLTERVFLSAETTVCFQPESFSEGVLIATREPTRRPSQVSWRIPDELARFEEAHS